MKNTSNKIVPANLIGDDQHKTFLELQTGYGIAQRGGSKVPQFSTANAKRISTDINLLTHFELKKIIFSVNVFNN